VCSEFQVIVPKISSLRVGDLCRQSVSESQSEDFEGLGSEKSNEVSKQAVRFLTLCVRKSIGNQLLSEPFRMPVDRSFVTMDNCSSY
jgi:hypothetical protein